MSAIDRTQPPEPSALRRFDFPAARRSQLDNGLTVLVARHGRVPVATAQLVIDAGALREDAARAGVAHLTASALDAGTRKHTAEQLAWEFERLGAEFEAEAGWDVLAAGTTVPSERLEPALALLAEVVREPSFPEAEVRRLRDEQLAEILQRRKEPRALATDMAAHFIFGPDVPYGRPLVGTRAALEALDRERVAEFHRRQFVPAGAALLLVGELDEEDAAGLAARHFGGWAGDASPAIAPPPDSARRATTVFVVDRPDAAQSEIRVGHVGVPRSHTDYFAIMVMNTIVGGAFTSRLNLSLRERHGFTYGVRSGFAFRRVPGPFLIQTAVATEVTGRAVAEILNELRSIRDHGVTEEEVDAARRYLAGVTPLELQTTEQLAGRLADLFVFDLPDDYFTHYRERIAEVTREDVARVAREQLRLDDLAVVVVGRAEIVAPELERIAPVELHAVPA